MTWMNEVENVLQQYRGGASAASGERTQSDFTTVSQSAPPSAISSGLAAAFRSTSTPAFPDMIAQLFGQSNAAQRSGILGHLLPAAGRSSETPVTQSQAQQVSPDSVRQLAHEAETRDPSIIDRASEFYAQHPTLVKGLGAVALATLMSHVSRQH